MSQLKQYNWKETPQSEPIPTRSDMVENNAGGYVFGVDQWTRLDRFLILGSDSPTYYTSARELTVENAEIVLECLGIDPGRTVDRVVEISVSGRAPRNDQALFALAMASSVPNQWTRSYALSRMPEVARTGSHLLQFVSFAQQFRGWGRGLRRAVSNWYLNRSDRDLAYQVVKYRQRGGFSQRDALRRAHPVADSGVKNDIFHWVAQGNIPSVWWNDSPIGFLRDFKRLQDHHASTLPAAEVIKMIREHRMTWEMIPDKYRGNPHIWEALLEHMPLTAMIRQLRVMTSVGLLRPMSDHTAYVVDQITDPERIRKARVHPLSILGAMVAYDEHRFSNKSGYWEDLRRRKLVESGSVVPVPAIVDALDASFYHAFDNVEATGKRFLIAVDVSGSMSWSDVSGMKGVTPRIAAAALALVTASIEPQSHIMAFHQGVGDINITPRMRLDDVLAKTDSLVAGGTDCALPMIWATKYNMQVDCFQTLTDNETWAGRVHPVQALQRYRDTFNPSARMAVVGMVSNGFSIADPEDAGQLDIVGMDTSVPGILRDFVLQ